MMFITHFNKLIRNKILWTIFAAIIICSFVLWTTQTGGSQSEASLNRTGKLDGKIVPEQEFQSAYFNSMLSISLMFGRPIKITARVNEELRGMAWRRLVSLRAAQSMAISVTPDEVVAAIQQQPYFLDKGQFQQDRYNMFVGRFLASLQTSEAQFEEYIRQELILNKTKHLLAQGAWVAPLEVEQVFDQLYDAFVVSYVFLAQDDVAPLVKVSEDQAQAYFEGHRESFKIPEKMRVKWVAFPIELFLDEGNLDEQTLRFYYDEYIEDFTVRDSNDQLLAKPFEVVEDDLRSKMAWEAALAQAGDRASDFEVALAPDRQGKAPSFEDAARAGGLCVATSSYFAVSQTIPGLEDNLEFSKAAFELRQTPDDYFSRVLTGSNAYYLLALDNRVDARIPEYAEVRSAVIEAAQAQAITEKLEQLARLYYELALDGVEQGLSFTQSLQGTGLEVETTEPFSVKEGFENTELEYFNALVKEVLTHNSGEMTKLIPVKNGYVFGRVDSRQPASRTLLESARADLVRYIRRSREGLVFNEWEGYLLASAKFEDLLPKQSAASEFADDDAFPEDEFPDGEDE